MVFYIKTQLKNVLSFLLIITIIEYTVFSVRISNFYSFIVTLLLSITFYINDSKNIFKFGLLYSIIISFLSFYISFDITIFDNVYYYIFNYLKIHLFAIITCLCFKKELDFKSTVTSIFFISLSLVIFDLAKYKFIDKISFYNELSGGLELYLEEYNKTLTNAGINFDSEQIYALFFKVKDIILLLYPSFVVITAFIESFLVYFFTRIIIGSVTQKRFNSQFKLRNFYIGKTLSFLVLILLVISPEGSMFENAVYNFTLVASFIYLINGFAVIEHKVSALIKNNILLYFCMLLILIFSTLTVLILPTINGISIMFIIGITDTTFDYRKIRPKKFLIKK